MRHRIKGKKFNRNRGSRKALIKNFLRDFFISEKLETTLPKAKYVKPEIEKIITLAKKDTLASRRLLIKRIGDKKVVKKLLSDIGPRFKNRSGGYTRLVRTSVRKGDLTQLALITLVESSKTKKAEGTKLVAKQKKKEKTETTAESKKKQEKRKIAKKTGAKKTKTAGKRSTVKS